VTTEGGEMAIECPECGGRVALENRMQSGERVDCPECGETLEAIIWVAGEGQPDQSSRELPDSRRRGWWGPVSGP
jgi:lysine biosynthesis protein LysW